MAEFHTTPLIVGLGEVLWDMFPHGNQLGGAPTNFAVACARLGAQTAIASAVGKDRFGDEARSLLEDSGLKTAFLQQNDLPTGSVTVHVDGSGQPFYRIEEQVAWDALEWNEQWSSLARRCDAVCFGTLAQRTPHSRATIQNFLRETRPETVRVFDVNLRGSFYDAEVLASGLQCATILKLNEDELPIMLEACALEPPSGHSTAAHALLAAALGLRLVCITLGDRGCLLATRDTQVEHQGFPTQVKDTVGAGDAFTAGLVTYWTAGRPLRCVAEAANRLGSFVASSLGAMPEFPSQLLVELDALAGGD